MSTTTQILFNSPALHSLKRDQLVKLCKIHSLKASGKNKDIIERLKLHAKTLPLDDPLSIAIRSETADARPCLDSEDEAATDHSQEASISNNNATRPNEQWDVVMDTIAEVDEETLRSNRGALDSQVGEFGTTKSKASVTSSLRAIASSLGLKRNPSKANGASSLTSKDVPTSEVDGAPMAPPLEPIPGQTNLEGLPAPSTGRLSLSQAPATTTIRLISNHPPTNPDLLLSPPKLKPFATSFDLIPATPGGAESSSVSVWPCSPSGAARESLYPPIPDFGDLHNQSPRYTQYDPSDMDIDVDVPGGLLIPSIREPTPEKPGARFNTGATPKSSEKPSAQPIDIFSPAPKPQNASARTRLGIPRSEPFVFGSPLPQNNMSNLQFRTAAQSVLDEMNKRLAVDGVEAVGANVLRNQQSIAQELAEKKESNDAPRIGDMFERVHQKEFDKMDSITSHYAAKRGTQSAPSEPILSKKRKSNLVVKERPQGVVAARHRPNGSRVASGASIKTLPGGFAEQGDEDDEADRRLSKRPRVEREESDGPTQPDRTSTAPIPDAEEEARKQKEREVIRRRLEHNKAKRRSSMGRPSLGRAPPSQAKPARPGFFASAKSLVQNVWNRGAGSKAPFPRPAEVKKSVATGASDAPFPNSQPRRMPSGGSNTLAPGRSALAAPTVSTASSRLWKSPTSLLNPPGSSTAAGSKSSTIAGRGQFHNRINSLTGFSSLGRKTSLAASSSRIASTEAKSSNKASAANPLKQPTGIPRARTMSTLMAPTASSLAKMNTYARSPVTTNENATLTRVTMGSKQRLPTSPQSSATLDQITNSPQSPAPRLAKIFSQPLTSPSAGAPMSLTAAATSIIGQISTPAQPSRTMAKASGIPKAKVLPGRRPRISRSKVIARLASQRAAGTGPSASAHAGTHRSGGKVRSSMGAGVTGKTRQSYAGMRGGEMMGAKKRVRQSEYARRKSRVVSPGGGEGARGMDVD